MSYYIVSIAIIVIAFIPFIISFERSKPKARELVVIAVMVSLGVIGRVAFFMLPQCKPVVAVVIIAAVSLGARAGFLTGALIAFVSNFIFGQGPWTIYQMIALALIGLLAGMIPKCHRQKTVVCVFGFLSSLIIYGLLLDTASVIMFTGAVNPSALLTAITAGLFFNLILAVSTTVFLFLLYNVMTEKLDRLKVKYGMYEKRADVLKLLSRH